MKTKQLWYIYLYSFLKLWNLVNIQTFGFLIWLFNNIELCTLHPANMLGFTTDPCKEEKHWKCIWHTHASLMDPSSCFLPQRCPLTLVWCLPSSGYYCSLHISKKKKQTTVGLLQNDTGQPQWLKNRNSLCCEFHLEVMQHCKSSILL